MALDYTLSLNSSNIEDVYDIAKRIGEEYGKPLRKDLQKSRNIYKLDILEEEGIIISIYENSRIIFYKDLEFKSNYNILFRLDKEVSNLSILKFNMLNIIKHIIKSQSSQNYLLSYNSEIMILCKGNSNFIKINNISGFWSDKKLIDIFDDLSLQIVNENEEIDYFQVDY